MHLVKERVPCIMLEIYGFKNVLLTWLFDGAWKDGLQNVRNYSLGKYIN